MMGEMQNVDMRTPIEIALDIDSDNMTTASKLYEFLGLSPSNYSKWCKTNITENEFATENEDFTRFVIEYESGVGTKQREDYRLTAHFAKKLSVKSSGARAEEAREYFTRLEEKVKQKTIDRTKLSSNMRIILGMAESMAQQELEQKRISDEQKKQGEQIKKIEETQTTIAETFKSTSDIDNFQRWVSNCISKIAESPKFTDESTRSTKYSMARSESYKRLTKKRNCRLDDRVQRAKGRALEERPDIKKAELNKINKLYVIANDKDLRPAYELVIKEMMMCYCVGTK